MPTIKFELKDPKRCDGCMFQKLIYKEDICEHVASCFFEFMPYQYSNEYRIQKYGDKRPQSCIDKYGE